MKTRPGIRLGGRGLSLLLFIVIAVTMTILIVSTIRLGRASDQSLPVTIGIDKRPVELPDGSGAVMTEVIVVQNESDDPIPNLDISINGQYFLYRDKPLPAREEIVVPQSIFSTKSNQRYDCKKYPVESLPVTGRLPSGSRGVIEKEYEQ